MSVEDRNKIDIIFLEEENHRVVLVITDHLNWKEDMDEGEHLLLLQNKINAYLYFIESGQMVQNTPEWKDIPVVIQVDAMHVPTENAARFYRLIGEIVSDAGSSLQLLVTPTGSLTRF
jgi:hypothetical protein